MTYGANPGREDCGARKDKLSLVKIDLPREKPRGERHVISNFLPPLILHLSYHLDPLWGLQIRQTHFRKQWAVETSQ